MTPIPLGAVLLFNTRGTSKTAAKLHAAGCSMLRIASTSAKAVPGGNVYLGKRTIAVDGFKAVADEVADLEDRGYKVTPCKCLAASPARPCGTCGGPDASTHGDDTLSVYQCDRCCDAQQRAGRYTCNKPHATKNRKGSR